MIELFWLLLPVAAASGWWAGSNRGLKKKDSSKQSLSADYYQGLNYLLNEQQDKALGVFLRLVEADSETIETHLALGGLFRRRGEVERAIRIHQNLLARPSLEQNQRSIAILELAKDYMHAGLFDRAESLFHELVRQRSLTTEALRNLLAIYQREREWGKAIEAARKLVAIKEHDVKPVIAHCYCEIAVSQQHEGNLDKSIHSLNSALTADPESVRATILLGDMYMKMKAYDKAYQYYLRIFVLDQEFVSEVFDKIIKCIENGVVSKDFDHAIHILINDKKHKLIIPGLVSYLYKSRGAEEARGYIERHLHSNPTLTVLQEWLDFEKTLDLQNDAQIETVTNVINKIVKQTSSYQCRNCGYGTAILHWQCPSCKSWSTIKPTAKPVSV